ncbi:MAG: hypothetical protein NT145_04730, partial [Elusimicrobia bacterium]|nr:hypothetical protein [Elusimicrobiota bacterium]
MFIIKAQKLMVSSLIVFCFMLNGFIPRFSIGQKDIEVIEQILENQGPLLKFFSCISVPLNIVNKIFSESGNGFSDTQKEKSKQEEKNSTLADFSFISLGKNITKERYNLKSGFVNKIDVNTISRFFYLARSRIFVINNLIEDIFTLFNKNFILFPRGGISTEDEASLINFIGNIDPSLENSTLGLFFYTLTSKPGLAVG